MRRSTVPLFLAALAFTTPAFAQTPAGSQGAPAAAGSAHPGQEGRVDVSQQDRSFLDHTARENQGEIRLCMLAETRATNPAVEAFARLMVDDHIEVENQLGILGRMTGVNLPDGVTQEDHKVMAKVDDLQGAQFDRSFIDALIQDHTQAVQQFSQEIGSTQDPMVKNFAIATQFILRQHLALAKAVQDSMQDNGKS